MKSAISILVGFVASTAAIAADYYSYDVLEETKSATEFALKNNYKNQIRHGSTRVEQMADLLGSPWVQDDAGYAVSPTIVNDLLEMEQKGLKKGRTYQEPWSASWWPDFSGSIAARYAKPLKPSFNLPWAFSNWFITGINDRNLKALRGASQDEIDQLAPSEKYDLITGNDDFAFTYKVMQRISQMRAKKKAAMFSGICHGWGPASLNEKRPVKTVRVATPYGFYVTFYPDDIKALLAWKWAQSDANFTARLRGSKCEGGVKRDKNGRIIDTPFKDDSGQIRRTACFDVNPAVMHLALVNRVGVQHKGFIMDRSYGKSVANEPVFAYRYRYYNPITGRSESRTRKKVTLAQATVNLDGKVKDPFSEYRSPYAKKIVGIEMTVWYVKEAYADHDTTDSPKDDKVGSLDLRYDLEIDQYGQIVGGEWHLYRKPGRKALLAGLSYNHPDFIWMIPDKTIPFGRKSDRLIGEAIGNGEFWNDIRQPMPRSWQKAARWDIFEMNTDEKNKGINRPIVSHYIVDALAEAASK